MVCSNEARSRLRSCETVKQPAECVVSYPNFQDFASYTSRSTNIGFLCIRKNAQMGWRSKFELFSYFAILLFNCLPFLVALVQGQLSWSTNIGFLNLFSYFEQHSSKISVHKGECLGCPQFLKLVE